MAFGLITKRLKILAKELKCTVLLLTQLSREVAKRPDKRPMPSDGRDTGQIEQDCDFWLAVHKQAVYENEIVIKWPDAIASPIISILYGEDYDLKKKSGAFVVFKTLFKCQFSIFNS